MLNLTEQEKERENAESPLSENDSNSNYINKSKLDKRIKKYNRVKSYEEKPNSTDLAYKALMHSGSLSNGSATSLITKSKDVCLIEESPFYIHKVGLLFFLISI
jgi:hypothetical protein